MEFFNDALNVKVCYVIGLYSSVCCVFLLCNPPCHFYIVAGKCCYRRHGKLLVTLDTQVTLQTGSDVKMTSLCIPGKA